MRFAVHTSMNSSLWIRTPIDSDKVSQFLDNPSHKRIRQPVMDVFCLDIKQICFWVFYGERRDSFSHLALTFANRVLCSVYCSRWCLLWVCCSQLTVNIFRRCLLSSWSTLPAPASTTSLILSTNASRYIFQVIFIRFRAAHLAAFCTAFFCMLRFTFAWLSLNALLLLLSSLLYLIQSYPSNRRWVIVWLTIELKFCP